MTFVPPAEKCPKCHWPYPGFHVCVIDLRTPAGKRHANTPVRAKKQTTEEKAEKEFRKNTNHLLRDRSAPESRNRVKVKEAVEKQILTLYTQEKIGIPTIAERTNLSYNVVRKVLHKHANMGNITVRKPGHTLAKGAI